VAKLLLIPIILSLKLTIVYSFLENSGNLPKLLDYTDLMRSSVKNFYTTYTFLLRLIHYATASGEGRPSSGKWIAREEVYAGWYRTLSGTFSRVKLSSRSDWLSYRSLVKNIVKQIKNNKKLY
jgi:hypothetical protein